MLPGFESFYSLSATPKPIGLSWNYLGNFCNNNTPTISAPTPSFYVIIQGVFEIISINRGKTHRNKAKIGTMGIHTRYAQGGMKNELQHICGTSPQKSCNFESDIKIMLLH
jgi:hypothetical protein